MDMWTRAQVERELCGSMSKLAADRGGGGGGGSEYVLSQLWLIIIWAQQLCETYAP